MRTNLHLLREEMKARIAELQEELKELEDRLERLECDIIVADYEADRAQRLKDM